MTDEETRLISLDVDAFVANWTAHGSELDAKGYIYENLFLILEVNEEQAGVTGCSIDKSVHFLKALGEKYQIDFFNRMNITHRDIAGKIHLSTRTEFEGLIKEGNVGLETIVFNNLIKDNIEFLNSWQIPFKDSWHSKVF